MSGTNRKTVIIKPGNNRIQVLTAGIQGPVGASAAYDDTEGTPASVGTSSSSNGTSNHAARRDHKHQLNLTETDARYAQRSANLSDMGSVTLARQNIGAASDAALQAHISNVSNPHATTKAQVGLGNADNTSDLNKPISTATQTALNAKLDDSQLDTDGTLAANSDTRIASQKATKTYVDAQIFGGATPDATAIVKGKVQLAGDLGGTAAAPTVNFGNDTLHVLKTGDTMSGGLVITTAVDATSALNVTNSAAVTVLNIDTANRRVGIGSTDPTAGLSSFQASPGVGIVSDGGIRTDIIQATSTSSASYPVQVQATSRGTLASKLATLPGDTLGADIAMGWDGFSWTKAAQILYGADSSGTVAAGHVAGNIRLGVSSNAGMNANALVINYLSQVGINKATPTVTLDVNGTASLNSNNITNVLDPVSAQDAATKHYVDTTATPTGTALLKASNLSDVASAATAFGNIKQAATTGATGVVQLAGDLGGTAAAPIVKGRMRVFDAYDYGLVADGSTNDGAHIQAVIDAANAAGGGIVELPAATIAISTRIVSKSNVLVRGKGKGVTILLGTDAGDWIFYNTSAIANFGLQDMTLDLDTTVNGSGVSLSAATECMLLRVEFLNGAAAGWFLRIGAFTSATDGVTCRNNKVIDCDFDTHAGTLEMFLLFNAEGTEIIRPRFTGSSSPALGLWQKCYNTKIIDPSFYDSTGSCIYYSVTVENTFIVNPYFENTGSAIIGANTSDNGNFGLHQAQNLQILNPQIKGGANSTASTGIQLGSVNNVTVSNPVIENMQVGISLDDGNHSNTYPCTNFTITNPEIRNNNSGNSTPALHPGIKFSGVGGSLWGEITGGSVYDDLNGYQAYPITFTGAFTWDHISINRVRLSKSGSGTSITLNSGAALGPDVLIENNQDYTGTNPAQPRTKTSVFNVQAPAYGATGNGTTDDYAAIQACVNACIAVGGGEVFFPAGVYLVSQSIIVDGSAVTLRGASANFYVDIDSGADHYNGGVIAADGAVLVPKAGFTGAYMIVNNSGQTFLGQYGGFCVEDLRIYCKAGGATSGSSLCGGIAAYAPESGHLRNVRVEQPLGIGLYAVAEGPGGDNFNMENCSVIGNTSVTTIGIFSSMYESAITGCQVLTSQIGIQVSNWVAVQGCTVDRTSQYGYEIGFCCSMTGSRVFSDTGWSNVFISGSFAQVVGNFLYGAGGANTKDFKAASILKGGTAANVTIVGNSIAAGANTTYFIYQADTSPGSVYSAGLNLVVSGNSCYGSPIVAPYYDAQVLSSITGVLTAASSTLTSTNTEVNDGDTITVAHNTYRFKNTMSQAYDVKRDGTTADATMGHLIKAINGNGVAGTDYFAGTIQNQDVTAGALASHAFVVTAYRKGTVGNSLVSTTTASVLSWTGATLAGGIDGVFDGSISGNNGIPDLNRPLVPGSTSAGGNLSLSSTSHDTKGKILMGGSAVDEAQQFFGLNTTAPAVPIHGTTGQFSQVPLMTSDTTPSGTSSASNFVDNSNKPFMAFDHDLNTKWTTTNGITSAQLEYDFGGGNAKVISAYAITGPPYNSTIDDQAYAPKTWTIQGSNDNSTWTTLDTRTNVAAWAVWERRSYAFSNTTAYRYYRLNVSANQGGAGIIVTGLELYNYAPDILKIDKAAVQLGDIAQSSMTLSSAPVVTWTTALTLGASTTTKASLNLPSGVAPSSPLAGDLWYDGTHLRVRIGSTTYQLDQQGGGDALTTNPLSQFAATTSAQLAGVITNETGSGALVFGISPNITTPTGIVKGDVGLGNVDNTSDVNKPVSTAQQAALDLKANLSVSLNTQTASYTLVLGDAGLVVEMNVASSNTLTVPPNSSIAFPVGTIIEIFQLNTGQVTITPGAGVTLDSNGGKLKTSGQYASASLRKRATNEWVVAGDLTT